ncbi:hypothetical protein [Pseudactinotalea sp. Z1732]|uniref:hypothetical protein n=1 Tax=Pseudactinotalea sp. Z1732 TaxID=3413026 RepID=UPI003C79A85E
MRFGRGKKTRLPAEMAGLVRGEVLAAAQLRGGGWLVLTPAAVVVIGTGSGDFERAWHTVDRGEWSSDGNRIQLTWVDGHEPVELQLVHDDRELADILRGEVEASLVHAEVERLPGGGTLRGAIRRDAEGQLFSQVSVSGRVHRGEDLDQRVRAMEGRVRAQVGLPQ